MKKYFAGILVLFFISTEAFAQAAPATPPPRLTVSEFAERVEERSFRGCTTASALEGTGNPGRGARTTRPPARRTGVQR